MRSLSFFGEDDVSTFNIHWIPQPKHQMITHGLVRNCSWYTTKVGNVCINWAGNDEESQGMVMCSTGVDH